MGEPSAPKPKKLLDKLREAIRLRHYSIRAAEACVSWVTQLILIHKKRYPSDMGIPEINNFLTRISLLSAKSLPPHKSRP